MSKKAIFWTSTFILSSIIGIAFSCLAIQEQLFDPFSVVYGKYALFAFASVGAAFISRRAMG